MIRVEKKNESSNNFEFYKGDKKLRWKKQLNIF